MSFEVRTRERKRELAEGPAAKWRGHVRGGGTATHRDEGKKYKNERAQGRDVVSR